MLNTYCSLTNSWSPILVLGFPNHLYYQHLGHLKLEHKRKMICIVLGCAKARKVLLKKSRAHLEVWNPHEKKSLFHGVPTFFFKVVALDLHILGLYLVLLFTPYV